MKKKVARKAEEEIRALCSKDTWTEMAVIREWKSFALRMGLADELEMPAQMNLVKRVVGGGGIPKINNVVDAANIVAIKSRCPVGVFDYDAIVGDIAIRLPYDGEKYVPIMSSERVECQADEVIYADEVGIFSRYCKDAHRTRITENTRSILCVVDGTPEISSDHVVSAVHSLRDLLIDIGGEKVSFQSGIVVA